MNNYLVQGFYLLFCSRCFSVNAVKHYGIQRYITWCTLVLFPSWFSHHHFYFCLYTLYTDPQLFKKHKFHLQQNTRTPHNTALRNTRWFHLRCICTKTMKVMNAILNFSSWFCSLQLYCKTRILLLELQVYTVFLFSQTFLKVQITNTYENRNHHKCTENITCS